MIEGTRLESIGGLSAKLAIVSDSLASYVRNRKGALEELLAKVCGRTLRIEFVEAFNDEHKSQESESQQSSPRAGVDPVSQAEVMKDPVVRRAVDLFGARIVEITGEPSEER